ncbi:MAG: Rare lipoprotein A precursor [uncultured Sulfurovum sp.]|uniref:Probable endolytic peptidoglycan transglycosylase RlpA n=1 Tax=uncultured Sulfurovum sp. TaxID=269237 RepID=A0A6S6U8U4_9BACT|nr:MAG: Rare lipoprotein A precursor [uncultured Sulfurovum sp.]
MNMIKKIILLALFTTLTFSTTICAKDSNIRNYEDRGIKYYPFYAKKGTIKRGKASWYGKPFHGRLTANGEKYNMHAMTAAHRTYALGTVLKVTSLHNWKSVIVRVNDRGPFYNSRDVDLSYGAAKKLGFVNKGIEKVKIEVLSSGKSSNTKYVKHNANKTQNVIRTQKVQVASFFDKENATLFKQKHQLKNAIIVKKYIKDHKKTAYKIIVKCTPWEANKLLKSKKFSGAYKV